MFSVALSFMFLVVVNVKSTNGKLESSSTTAASLDLKYLLFNEIITLFGTIVIFKKYHLSTSKSPIGVSL